MKSARQLKAKIKNLSAEKKVPAQILMRLYMMERLLERISVSNYKDKFIIKGGLLISSLIGVGSRVTMDLDATIKKLKLEKEIISKAFEEIFKIDLEDNITFEILKISEIRLEDIYPGLRISAVAFYEGIKTPLSIDMTTGDKITPKEIGYEYPLLFEDRKIKILAYNLETVLAEKLHTVLARGITNTRQRDFYDIWSLYNLKFNNINFSNLKSALEVTATKRGTPEISVNYKKVIEGIKNNEQMLFLWEKYRKDYLYAQDINFQKICDLIVEIMDNLK